MNLIRNLIVHDIENHVVLTFVHDLNKLDTSMSELLDDGSNQDSGLLLVIISNSYMLLGKQHQLLLTTLNVH